MKLKIRQGLMLLNNLVATGQLMNATTCWEMQEDINFHIPVQQSIEIQNMINFITYEAISDKQTNQPPSVEEFKKELKYQFLYC